VELIAILLLTLVAFPVVELTEGVPRIILGIIVLLLFPGYTLIAALFPSKESLKGVERAALSLVMSFAIVSLTGLILNFTPLGIRLTPIFVAMAIIIFLASVIALFRRYSLPEAERFTLSIKIRRIQWGSVSKFDKILSIVLAVAVIGAASVLAYVIAHPKAEETFTNFYILGPEGKMENYPQELALGEQAEVALGIENQENQDASYNIVVTLDGEEIQTIGPIRLADEQEWRDNFTLVPSKAGENQKVEFLLYKGEGSAPYLNLHLWLDVRE
jgi:uncharacterized membrane protein